MKITYLLTTPDAGAGTERAVFTQAALLADDHQIEIVGVFRTEDAPHFSVPRGIKFRYLVDRRHEAKSLPSRLVPAEWDNQFTVESDRAIVAFFRRSRSDVFVTTTPALAALAVEFSHSKAKVVHEEHRSAMHRGNTLPPLISHGSRLDLIVNLTERSQTWLQQRLGSAAPPMVVVPNAYEPGVVPKTGLNQPLIISAGRFSGGKNFPDLVRAFAEADSLVPGWRLRIYGDGPGKGAVQATVRHHGLVGRVDLVPPTGRLAAEFSKGSIFAMTSLAEGLPMVGIEAARAGLPLVGYDVETGPAEIVAAGGGGVLVPKRGFRALGATLAYLMGDSEVLRHYSERAVEGARTYSPHNVRRRWLEVFDMVARAGRAQESGSRDAVPDHESQRASEEVADPLGVAASWRSSLPDEGELEEVEQRLEACFEAAQLDFARVPSSSTHTAFVFDAGVRETVLEILQLNAAAEGLRLRAFRNTHELSLAPWSVRDDAPPALAYSTVVHVAMDVPALSEMSASRSIVVEFWESDEDGVRHAPRQNTVASWVSDPQWHGWIKSGSRTVSGARVWDEVAFPVDVVYTWVDGSDPSWIRKKARFSEQPGFNDIAADSTSEARFRNRNEIFYSIASVRRFMPWVRNIYIVTDQQVPHEALKKYPDLKVVDHRDIFPDPDVLPVFNSHAIESCLHRVPGLAEHFIYMNDDVIVARPLSPEQFFLANGTAKFFTSSVKVNHGAIEAHPHLAAATNNRGLLIERFEMEITRSMLHTPHPHRRSVLERLEREYPAPFRMTRSSRFRSGTDISVLSSLGQYYGYATGHYAPGNLRYSYLSLRGAELETRLKRALADRRLDVFALGEPQDQEWRHPDELALLIRFLELVVRSAPSEDPSGPQ